MELLLLHGRNSPDENLVDWGFTAPSLLEVKYIHVTYLTTWIVGFHTEEAAKKAAEQTGWEWWDDFSLEISFQDDLLKTKAGYFGDWELVESSPKPTLFSRIGTWLSNLTTKSLSLPPMSL